jgi:hypothetical protein
MVRGTADPSAALGMTKGRVALPWRAVAGLKEFFISYVMFSGFISACFAPLLSFSRAIGIVSLN